MTMQPGAGDRQMMDSIENDDTVIEPELITTQWSVILASYNTLKSFAARFADGDAFDRENYQAAVKVMDAAMQDMRERRATSDGAGE